MGLMQKCELQTIAKIYDFVTFDRSLTNSTVCVVVVDH